MKSRPALRCFWLPMLASAGWTGACWIAAGNGLGLYLGALPGIIILSAAFATADDPSAPTRKTPCLAALAVAIGTALVWCGSTFFTSEILPRQWLRCSGVAAAVAFAAAAMAAFLRRIRFPAALASAITIVLGLAWLTWPIWLANVLSGTRQPRIVDTLVLLHPLMAINGTLANLGIWSEQTIAYHLTDLNQSTPYHLPRTVAWCAAAHALFAIALLSAGSGAAPAKLQAKAEA